jgi:PIN domain nuclease of toxin-antitoxin system
LRILLDTQSWLWLVGALGRLSPKARGVIQDPANELPSAASSWEIAIRHAIGNLELPGDPDDVVPDWIVRSAVTPLAVVHSHTLRVASLPFPHADPFDRLLIAHAPIEDVPVLTSDPAFRDCDVEPIAA